ncbi:MAG: restriction endonuclease [Candidatus Bathyarchaeota archaeon]|nr:restriction endonuclease [Candidatus Bathyarchaeota archaeon]
MPSTFVSKADGTKQLFERGKIEKTCLRMGATHEIARIVANEIERQVYNGIQTRKILGMIFNELSKHKPAVKYQICLRKGLSLMKPKPDFEHFVQILLRKHGYEVSPNLIIQGKCVDHEIDALAKKNGETILVEVKHHYNYHTPTGLDESRIVRAVFEDITEGFEAGLNNYEISKSMIVCNTKFSDHAKRYTECRGIQKIGWSSPSDRSLQDMIEEKKLYPIQCLKGLSTESKEKLTDIGIILISQLAAKTLKELRKTGIPKETLTHIINKARIALSGNESIQR